MPGGRCGGRWVVVVVVSAAVIEAPQHIRSACMVLVGGRGRDEGRWV